MNIVCGHFNINGIIALTLLDHKLCFHRLLKLTSQHVFQCHTQILERGNGEDTRSCQKTCPNTPSSSARTHKSNAAFSKRLASKGLKVTLLTFTEKPSNEGEGGLISFESSSNTSEESRLDMDADDYMQKLQDMVALKLPQIVAKHEESGFPVSCLIYDSILPWSLELARKVGNSPAVFFTQSCAVCAIYYAVHEGRLKKGFAYSLYKPRKVASWMTSKSPIRLIGPTIPSMYLDKRLENDKDYGLNLIPEGRVTVRSRCCGLVCSMFSRLRYRLFNLPIGCFGCLMIFFQWVPIACRMFYLAV